MSSRLPAATLTVDLNGGADFTEIQPAIDRAADGDSVIVLPGEYVIQTAISFRGKAIVVRGDAGAERTTIRLIPPQGDPPPDPPPQAAVEFDGGEGPAAILEGFTIAGDPDLVEHCGFDCRAGIYVGQSAPTIIECRMTHNAGSGARCGSGASPRFLRCEFRENAYSMGGGVTCLSGSSPSFVGCRIEGNVADQCGGLYIWEATASFSDSRIAGNSGGGSSGAMYSAYSSVTFDRCTIAGNAAPLGAGGLYCNWYTSLTMTRSIIWGNTGPSLHIDSTATSDISQSCIQSPEPWPGAGNIRSDPLFCGWGELSDVAAVDQEGFSAAIGGYSLAIAQDSPCRAAGMGADAGTCEASGVPARLVRLSAGDYRMYGWNLVSGASIDGAGADRTVIHGSIQGLRSGAALRGVALTGRSAGGVAVVDAQAPEIADCRIFDCWTPSVDKDSFGAVYCGESSAPRFTRCVIEDNLIAGIQCGLRALPIFTGCAVRDNEGPGVRCAAESVPVFTDCWIAGNKSGGVLSYLAAPQLDRCTIAANLSCSGSGGIDAHGAARAPVISRSIIWDNLGGSISVSENSPVKVSFSCVEGPGVWPGEGNIVADPQFCGWGDTADVVATDQAGLDAALSGFSVALSASSPCRAQGMGADAGECPEPGAQARVVHLGPGEFHLAPRTMVHRISIEGAGEGATVITDTVRGLRTGAHLSEVTVARPQEFYERVPGILVCGAEAPEISRSTIRGWLESGIVCISASPTIAGCTVEGCSAVYTAAVDLRDSSAILTACRIAGNVGRSVGGGVRILRGAPVFSGCEIVENSVVATAFPRGGGVYCSGATATFLRSAIDRNNAESGAGILCDENSSLTLEDCTISGNEDSGGKMASVGGGVLAYGGSLNMVRCLVSGNRAAWEGAGVDCLGGVHSFTNCVIAANECAAAPEKSVGAGIAWRALAPSDVLLLTNCTIAGNVGDGIGARPESLSSRVEVVNSIVWGNTRSQIMGFTDIDVRYSCIQGEPVWPGPGNIAADPLFIDPAGGDFRIAPKSPAVDSATAEGAPPTDIEGNSRPCGAGVDMGADEYCGGLERPFIRGDSNGDGRVDISDPIHTLDFLFLGGQVLRCRRSGDGDDNGRLEITDPIHVLNHLFLGGPAPPRPYPACGPDATPDALTCVQYDPCV